MSYNERRMLVLAYGEAKRTLRHMSQTVIPGMMHVRDVMAANGHRTDAPTVHPIPKGTAAILLTEKILKRGAKNRSFGKDDFRRGRKPRAGDPFTSTVNPVSDYSGGRSQTVEMDICRDIQALELMAKDKSISGKERRWAQNRLFDMRKRVKQQTMG